MSPVHAHRLPPALPVSPEAEAAARSPPGQWRLLAVALPCWAMTAWAVVTPGRGALVAWCAGALGAGALLSLLLGQLCARGSQAKPGWARWRQHASLVVSLLAVGCAAFLLVGTRIQVLEQRRADPYLQQAAEAATVATLDLKLTGFPAQRETALGTRAWVRAEAQRPGGPVPVLVWLSDATAIPDHWGPGVRLTLQARLRPQAPADPAAYTATPVALRERTPDQTIARVSARSGAAAALLRRQLVTQATAVPGAELVPGFAVGDTSLVHERLDAAMLESSLSHLTAVSGSNTGLVLAAVMWSMTRVGAGRRARIVAGAAGLLGFIAVVGPDASVQRAAVMAAVLLVGAFGGRRTFGLPALGSAVLVLLAFDPWQALQAGFTLSVAATGGILLLAAPCTDWLTRQLRLPRALALPCAVAFAAQLACGPLLLLLQPGLPAVGVLANIIAAPAAPLGTGLGLLAAVLGPLSPTLATLTVTAASLPARWVAATATVCADIPGGRWAWPAGWPGALLLLGCQCAWILAWALRTGRLGVPRLGRVLPRQPWQPATPAATALRTVTAVLFSLSLGVFSSLTLISPFTALLTTPSNWILVACDVGQGDAILARNPRTPDQVILIDTGEDPAALRRCLRTFRVSRIALLVLTHDDRDHVGALDQVLDRTAAVLISPTAQGTQLEQRPVVRSITAAGIPYRIGVAGMGRSAPATGITWQVLAPGPGVVPASTNAASLVLLLEFGAHRALLLADTGEAEQAQLRRDPMLRQALSHIDVVKFAHHGSRDQDAALYATADADWALISVGADNGYGHPHRDALGTLAQLGTVALRTDRHGSVAIVVQPDGTLAPWLEHPAETSPASAGKVGGAS